MQFKKIAYFLVCALLLNQWAYSDVSKQPLTELEWIGDLIFKNECDRKETCLVDWNEGEDFLSLGIGHFIWCPKLKRGPFQESFPELLSFLETKGVELPAWIKTLPDKQAPWVSREEFMNDREDDNVKTLTSFLAETKDLQAEFMLERFKVSIPKILGQVSDEEKIEIQEKISSVIDSRNSLYVLIDYVNFNGEGILKSERYQNQGWGLLQVLQEMKMPDQTDDAIEEFLRATLSVLERRVNNSSPERNEIRWLPGWQKRVQTYLTAVSPGIKRDYELRKIEP